LPDGCVDAVVTDPPYCSGGFTEAARRASNGSGLRSETRRDGGWFTSDNMGTNGFEWLMRHVAIEVLRVLRPAASFCVFTDWRMVPALSAVVESAGFRWQNMVVWDKGSAGIGRGFRATHEILLQFTNGVAEYHSASEGNVLRVGRMSTNDREHQTQKPVELMRKILGVVAGPDALVLDPFAGSGSTGVACLPTRRFIGIERESAYVDIARRRIADAAAQGNLFAETAS
jgi:DNA modification methylase